MSDLFGNVPEMPPREELTGKHILIYATLSYAINLVFLKTLLNHLPIEIKKVLFLFSPVTIIIESFGYFAYWIYNLLDRVF